MHTSAETQGTTQQRDMALFHHKQIDEVQTIELVKDEMIFWRQTSPTSKKDVEVHIPKLVNACKETGDG